MLHSINILVVLPVFFKFFPKQALNNEHWTLREIRIESALTCQKLCFTYASSAYGVVQLHLQTYLASELVKMEICSPFCHGHLELLPSTFFTCHKNEMLDSRAHGERELWERKMNRPTAPKNNWFGVNNSRLKCHVLTGHLSFISITFSSISHCKVKSMRVLICDPWQEN